MQSVRKTTKRRLVANDRFAESLLENIVVGKDLLRIRKHAKLFFRGDEADAIYFIQTGKVQLTRISAQGKEVVLAMRGPGEFLGEECLVGNSRRTSTATSSESSTVFRIERRAMLQALHFHRKLSDEFLTSLLCRMVTLQEDLRDQLFGHSERRLANVLLRLARSGLHDKLPDRKVATFTHRRLAEIVGTTRPRISFLMNKFRKLGLIDYDRGKEDITVMAEALTDSVLRE